MQHSICFQSLETQNYSTGLYALLQQVTFKSDTKPKLRTELNLAVLGGASLAIQVIAKQQIYSAHC
jgi:hypothetical protein